MNEWFIKLFRSLIDWEWYDDINVKVLFIHLLLKANFQDKNWRWIEIKKGEYLTSISNLSKETGLSAMQIRSCIKKLILTKEITNKTTANYTLLKLNNYEKYNWDNKQINKPITNEQQTNNKRVTTTKERKEYKESNNILITNIGDKISKEISPIKNKKSFQDLLNENFTEEFIKKLKIKYNITSENIKKQTELFIAHWIEKNENWKKELWQMKKTFDIRLRFYKWLALNENRNKQKNNNFNSWIVYTDEI